MGSKGIIHYVREYYIHRCTRILNYWSLLKKQKKFNQHKYANMLYKKKYHYIKIIKNIFYI